MDRPRGLPDHLFKGRRAETRARRHLEKQGLTFVEANYHCPAGEIDLIMKDKSGIVFIEVRYRKSQRFGGALESIDYRKQRKLRRAAEHYLQRRYPRRQPPCRIDVVLVSGSGRGAGTDPQLDWIRNAV